MRWITGLAISADPTAHAWRNQAMPRALLEFYPFGAIATTRITARGADIGEASSFRTKRLTGPNSPVQIITGTVDRLCQNMVINVLDQIEASVCTLFKIANRRINSRSRGNGMRQKIANLLIEVDGRTSCHDSWSCQADSFAASGYSARSHWISSPSQQRRQVLAFDLLSVSAISLSCSTRTASPCAFESLRGSNIRSGLLTRRNSADSSSPGQGKST